MRIGVVGAGYVGLVTGVCLADAGNDVVVADNDPTKLECLRRGESPHFEPGLDDLLRRNLKAARIRFADSAARACENTEIVFIAVGTPSCEDGRADLRFLEAAIKDVARAMDGYRLLVVKSTVPVGTNRRAEAWVRAETKHPFDIASNPEFLKEGAAIEDFVRPDRVVAGTRTERAATLLRRLYAPFLRTGRPILLTDPETAEMVKYVSNTLLASRISLMNEVSRICQAMGADVEQVRAGVGMDRRIGSSFLFAGLGYGGSCFPKGVRALAAVAEDLGLEAPMCRAINRVNVTQRDFFLPFVAKEWGEDWKGRRAALWGVAFKPQTDDVREAPAVYLARTLAARGAEVVAYDPEAVTTARRELGDGACFASDRYAALDGADALFVCTEWNEFRSPDFVEMRKRMRAALVFDGRNLYDPEEISSAGFRYYSVGRPPKTGA